MTASSAAPAPAAGATLGDRVRGARQARGLSLRAAAASVGVSAATLSAIENGRTRLTVARLERLAAVLDVPVASLLSGDGELSDGAGRLPARAAARGQQGEAVDYAAGKWRHYEPLDLGPVLTAVLESIVTTGYHGASIRDVARRAGLSVPGLYHHHASKQDMLVAILQVTMDDLLARARAAAADGATPLERLSLLIECLTLYHSYRRELAFVGSSEMRSLQPGNRARIVGMRNEVQALVDEQVDLAAARGEITTPAPHLASRAVVTMCTAVAGWYRTDGPSPPEELASRYAEFALDLLGARPA